MKGVIKLSALLIMIFSVLFFPDLQTPIYSEPQISGESGGKTLSPHFFVKSNDPATDQLPLKATSALVDISGVIADVTMSQAFIRSV